MTTSLKVTYTSGNGVIQVNKPNGETATLSAVGDETELHIHQGSDQVVTVQEVGFADDQKKACDDSHCGGEGKAANEETKEEGEDDNG